MYRPTRLFALVLTLSPLLLLTGCPPGGRNMNNAQGGPKLLSLDFSDPVAPAAGTAPVFLAAATNETVSFALQVNNLPRPQEKLAPVLRMQPLRIGAGKAPEDRIEPGQYTAYQLLPMPVDLNRAGFVRHTGLEATARRLPRALLPLPVYKGQINLAALRSPSEPRNPQSRAATTGEPVMLWIDLAVPLAARPGDYQTTFEVLQNGAVVSTLVINLKVNDFVIPDERHLMLVGRLEWPMLKRLYPGLFETARPELLTRKDPQLAAPLKVIDQLVKLGQQHRAVVVVPQLQPLVKWPVAAPPLVTWEDFDSIVLPWLKGDAFADHIPLGYWPLPSTESLANWNDKSRGQYWDAVATHFDQLVLLEHTAVAMEHGGRVTAADSFRLSTEAAQILALHPRVRISVPMEDDQVQFKSDNNAGLVDPATADRLVTASPGLVFNAPSGDWPQTLDHPPHWLRTDVPGLAPYIGAGGDERDVRLWAWLAFLRHADLIQWPSTLPSRDNPDQPADPNELIWFYPGEWFGVDEPLPTVQLKWLRRAQQDYEYLYLARARGENIRTHVMARLITKPVEIPLTQDPDQTYALMCGTTDLAAWEAVKGLLADSILLRPPGEQPDDAKVMDLNGRTLQWAVPLEKPLLLGRTTSWGWGVNPKQGNWIDLRLGLDIYNAADQRLIGKLQWSAAPIGWQFSPQPVEIPPNQAINTYNVRRFTMDAAINLERITATAESRQPIDLLFTNDLTNRQSLLRVLAPIAISDRRGPAPLKIDGDLDDWSQADAIQDGPLVRMFNRPAIQRIELQYASTPTQIYSGWAQDDFYLAFKVQGVQPVASGGGKNFVDYQFARAWGEDLCEVLMQPIYADGAVGAVLHLVCKPSGQLFIERKVNAKLNATPWESVVGEAVRYAARNEPKAESSIWRAEIAIPWTAINDAPHQGRRPSLLRFNFVQHKHTTGESASWAGPLDYGRDENFTGLLYLRDPANPGVK